MSGKKENKIYFNKKLSPLLKRLLIEIKGEKKQSEPF
jgi:hypothetical protein